MTDPWTGLEEGEHPEKWDDRLPILVLSEEPDRLNERLGLWLKEKLQKRRNQLDSCCLAQDSQTLSMIEAFLYLLVQK